MYKKSKAPLLQITSHWLILLLLSAGYVNAGTEIPFSHGLLFQIEKAGSPPSYIFGTMHSDDPRVLSLPKPIKERFDSSTTLALELDLDPTTMRASITGMLLQNGQTLHNIIGTPLYEQTITALTDRGIPEAAIQKFKPWGIVMLLSMPPTKTGQFLDLTLYQSAKTKGKTTLGLETVEEQLAIFDTLPEADQIAMLRDTLEQRDQFEQMFEELLTTYLKRQLGKLLQLSQKYGPTEAKLAANFEERLINQRNQLMVKRMQSVLKQGNSFIAIGALHLPGEKGILNLLKQQKYKITVIY